MTYDPPASSADVTEYQESQAAKVPAHNDPNENYGRVYTQDKGGPHPGLPALTPASDVALVNQETGEIVEEKQGQPAITMYQNASMLVVSPDEQKALQAPVDEDSIEVRPNDGLIYVPQVFFRDKLNKVFGIGAWALVQHSVHNEQDTIYFDGSLIVRGNFVARAMGEARYIKNNPKSSYGTAYESSKSDCLTRCCKDLGIARELWQPKFSRKFVSEHCVKVWTKDKYGKTGVGWRLKEQEPLWNETGLVDGNKQSQPPTRKPTQQPAQQPVRNDAPPPPDDPFEGGAQEQELKVSASTTVPKEYDASTDERLITEAQRKRMFAIWKQAGWTEAGVKAILKGKGGYTSSKDIKRCHYEGICQCLSLPMPPSLKDGAE